MKDYISIGNAPVEETNLAQLDKPDYLEKAKRECQAFIQQLRRERGDEPNGAKLTIKHNPHDFGTYLDVVCYFDDTNEAATKYAFACESETPAFWDEEAKRELGLL